MKLNHSRPGGRGFSLLEVMIAIAIFFVASFAILGLISSSLNNVRRLERPMVDASPVLAIWANTNSLVEGHSSGSLGDENLLGKGYDDYRWDLDIEEVASNHLYSLECKVTAAHGNRELISDMTTLHYAPRSPPGSLDGGPGMRGR